MGHIAIHYSRSPPHKQSSPHKRTVGLIAFEPERLLQRKLSRLATMLGFPLGVQAGRCTLNKQSRGHTDEQTRVAFTGECVFSFGACKYRGWNSAIYGRTAVVEKNGRELSCTEERGRMDSPRIASYDDPSYIYRWRRYRVTKKSLYIQCFGVMIIASFALGYLGHKSKHSETRRILYYQDPMHPSYRSDNPGIAPDCGMELVPVYADDVERSLSSNQGAAPGEVEIDSGVQQLYGIRLAKAEKDSGQNTVRVFARVEADETRVFHVNFGTDGFVKETHDDAIGDHVSKDQHLAVVYSPDFLAVAGGYLAANERAPGAANSARDNSAATSAYGAASAQARADRLRDLGMSDSQIAEMSKDRKVPEDVYVVSPTDGFILSRNVSSGMRFERHADLYTIADLSHVWIIAELFGKDAQTFRPGARARITRPDTGESFTATVSNVLPEVDPATHSLKTRLEADNPNFRLRPNMFVTVELPLSLPAGLTVPSDAVLDSGMSKRVFIQREPGRFEPRKVETGWQLNDRIQIVKGLKEGDIVVSSGTFLVDSESRLQLAHDSRADRIGNASEEHLETEHRAN
jgi:Cu(I)/Ag(I) efflux system membrane fusion protein